MSLSDVLNREKEDERIAGVVAAVVTNNQDPDGLGRIKLKFPWLSDENETDWVRMTTFMAGLERGAFFLPEVDDEVLVAFEHGDINCPYIIGALWNGTAKPPLDNGDGKNNIRSITSRSGHEIIFCDDEEGSKENLEIHTKAGHKVMLDDASGAEMILIVDKTESNKITIDSANNAIAIEAAGPFTVLADTVELEAGTSLTLKAPDIIVDASGSVEIKTGDLKMEGSSSAALKTADLKMEGSSGAEIKSASVKVEGSGATEVKSGGILTLKGSMTQIN
jgi:uncharacterized protein involved in type VI secretion and phage assembly